MTLTIDNPSIEKLKNLTWGCEEFWNTVLEENLEDKFYRAIDEFYPDGISLGRLNDLIRYDETFLEDVRNF